MKYPSLSRWEPRGGVPHGVFLMRCRYAPPPPRPRVLTGIKFTTAPRASTRCVPTGRVVLRGPGPPLAHGPRAPQKACFVGQRLCDATGVPQGWLYN